MAVHPKEHLLENERTVWAFEPFGPSKFIAGVWSSRKNAEAWILTNEASGKLACLVVDESVRQTTRRVVGPTSDSTHRLWEAHGYIQSSVIHYYEDGKQLGLNGRYPCSCCGYLTMYESPCGGSYDICEICNWEDEILIHGFVFDIGPGANCTSLVEARRHFEECGACYPGSTSRPPLPEETPRMLRPMREDLNYPSWR